MQLSELRRTGRQRLSTRGPDSAREADLLLTHCLGLLPSQLLTRDRETVSDQDVDRYLELIERRRSGEPVAHITGSRGFWTLDLKVTADTLIPRPETEMLVELALVAGDAVGGEIRVLDLCTGSGAVAVAIAAERPGWRVTGTDLSAAALAVAISNARAHALSNLQFKPGDLYQPVVDEQFQIIVANPPYIPDQDPHLDRGDLRFEPRLALAAGPVGTDVLDPLIRQAGDHLLPGGTLLVEHGYDQRALVLELAAGTELCGIEDLDDLAGIPRVLRARAASGP